MYAEMLGGNKMKRDTDIKLFCPSVSLSRSLLRWEKVIKIYLNFKYLFFGCFQLILVFNVISKLWT